MWMEEHAFERANYLKVLSSYALGRNIRPGT